MSSSSTGDPKNVQSSASPTTPPNLADESNMVLDGNENNNNIPGESAQNTSANAAKNQAPLSYRAAASSYELKQFSITATCSENEINDLKQIENLAKSDERITSEEKQRHQQRAYAKRWTNQKTKKNVGAGEAARGPTTSNDRALPAIIRIPLTGEAKSEAENRFKSTEFKKNYFLLLEQEIEKNLSQDAWLNVASCSVYYLQAKASKEFFQRGQKRTTKAKAAQIVLKFELYDMKNTLALIRHQIRINMNGAAVKPNLQRGDEVRFTHKAERADEILMDFDETPRSYGEETIQSARRDGYEVISLGNRGQVSAQGDYSPTRLSDISISAESFKSKNQNEWPTHVVIGDDYGSIYAFQRSLAFPKIRWTNARARPLILGSAQRIIDAQKNVARVAEQAQVAQRNTRQSSVPQPRRSAAPPTQSEEDDEFENELAEAIMTADEPMVVNGDQDDDSTLEEVAHAATQQQQPAAAQSTADIRSALQQSQRQSTPLPILTNSQIEQAVETATTVGSKKRSHREQRPRKNSAQHMLMDEDVDNVMAQGQAASARHYAQEQSRLAGMANVSSSATTSDERPKKSKKKKPKSKKDKRRKKADDDPQNAAAAQTGSPSEGDSIQSL